MFQKENFYKKIIANRIFYYDFDCNNSDSKNFNVPAKLEIFRKTDDYQLLLKEFLKVTNIKNKTSKNIQTYYLNLLTDLVNEQNGFNNNIVSNHVKKLLAVLNQVNANTVKTELIKNVLNICFFKINFDANKLISQKYLNLILGKILSCSKVIINRSVGNQRFISNYLEMPKNIFENQYPKKNELQISFDKENIDTKDIIHSLDLLTSLAYEDVTMSIISQDELNLPIGKYKITEEFKLPGTNGSFIKAIVLEPVNKSDKTAYIVFRGTPNKYHVERKENIRSVFSFLGSGIYEICKQLDSSFSLDVKKEKIFHSNYADKIVQEIITANSDILENKPSKNPLINTIRRLKLKNLKIVCVGHSLGGAMAAACYNTFPQFIEHAYTRNPPGISDFWIKVIKKLKDKGVHIEADKITHYNNFGDYIPKLLGKFGTYYIVSTNNINFRGLQTKQLTNFIKNRRIVHSENFLADPLSFVYLKEKVNNPSSARKQIFKSPLLFYLIRKLANSF